jgi:D-aminopeptidase
MICHEFKGGIGTSSRVVPDEAGGYTVGALVQANHGRRERLVVDGVPVGLEIPASVVPSAWEDVGAAARPSGSTAGATVPGTTASAATGGVASGPIVRDPTGGNSIIVILATDAPLLPHQCERLAQRAGLGVARMGGAGENSSGDLFLAFATGNVVHTDDAAASAPVTHEVTALADAHISSLFWAAIEATEEAILNALLAAETMVGRDGHAAYALPRESLLEALGRYGRLAATS